MFKGRFLCCGHQLGFIEVKISATILHGSDCEQTKENSWFSLNTLHNKYSISAHN